MLRHWFQAAFFAVTNGYAVGFLQGKIYQGSTKALCVPGLNCYSCPGALGSCPIGALQAVLDSRSFTVSAYVMGFLMGFGALFGRLICGWMCPFGLVQDLLYKIPFVKKIKNLPGHRYLKHLRYVILALFVVILPSVVVDIVGMGKPWFCEYICPSGTLFGGIPLVAANPELQSATGGLFVWKVSLLVVTGVLSVISYRPFCKYVCPLGAIYGWFNPVALYRYTVDAGKCTQCGACQKVCRMDIKVWEKPNSVDCIRCGDCKNVCPEGAIVSTWEKRKEKSRKRGR
ncbi:MAG: 4Fe-4S binding protein [Hespellia sp.]|nr:4Fe-4S binding protein [Hespellia sp.]